MYVVCPKGMLEARGHCEQRNSFSFSNNAKHKRQTGEVRNFLRKIQFQKCRKKKRTREIRDRYIANEPVAINLNKVAAGCL